jgi:UDP-N-acetylmuramoyl-tripeptide--D-alanyl-D-alanine ligase
MVLTKPIEWSIQNGFKRQAQERLNELRQKNGLIVVGVTGSYGKTSMKFILGTILGEKYKTYVTPDSFNTPMGLCRVVNERRLTDEHQIFIAEMGARYRKDIRELVNLVHPDHGIITAVGPAHLDTMRSLSNIANTKFDLARGVPSDGYVVVNGSNAICRETANSLGRPVFLYGTEGVDVSVGELSAFAKDIHIAETETEFTLVLPGDGEVECRTRLLGKHNILNITGAALMARKLGLSLEEIRRGIQKVQPVEHRLQLINPGTGVLVIDDAFNSNPEGAAMALEVLAGFEGRRKWIITPGMVEMGERQAEINRKFGAQMAQVCDFVVLVSQLNASAMKQGLMDAGFSEDRVFVVGSLDEGVKLFQAHVRPGDIVLFENDLPDHLERTS